VHWCDCCPQRSEETLKGHAVVELHLQMKISKEISMVTLSETEQHQERQAQNKQQKLTEYFHYLNVQKLSS
jgi:hypothetical protein